MSIIDGHRFNAEFIKLTLVAVNLARRKHNVKFHIWQEFESSRDRFASLTSDLVERQFLFFFVSDDTKQ